MGENVTTSGLYAGTQKNPRQRKGIPLKSDFVKSRNVSYKEDTYVWAPETIKIDGLYEIIRASFYTYTTGDIGSAVNNISSEIKKLNFNRHLGSEMHNFLHPVVFWKPKSAQSAKGVDVQLTIDILTHAFEDNFDILYLVSDEMLLTADPISPVV